jgi:hypothetical protein
VQVDSVNYASLRTQVKINGTNTTEVRDLMFDGVGTGGPPKRCTGQYRRLLYPAVTALFARGNFRVSQNSEWYEHRMTADAVQEHVDVDECGIGWGC